MLASYAPVSARAHLICFAKIYGLTSSIISTKMLRATVDGPCALRAWSMVRSSNIRQKLLPGCAAPLHTFPSDLTITKPGDPRQQVG